MYFAHISIDGPVKYGLLPGSIGVLGALDNSTQIGLAICRGWGMDGLAVWTLWIWGRAIPGRWVVIDRQFRAAQ
jgi:hypothetical protein